MWQRWDADGSEVVVLLAGESMWWLAAAERGDGFTFTHPYPFSAPFSGSLDIPLPSCWLLYSSLFSNPKESSQFFWLGGYSVELVHRGVLWEPEPTQVSGSSTCLEEGVKPLHFWQWWTVNSPFCILWNCILRPTVLTVQRNSCAPFSCKPWCNTFSFPKWVGISSYQIMISKW